MKARIAGLANLWQEIGKLFAMKAVNEGGVFDLGLKKRVSSPREVSLLALS